MTIRCVRLGGRGWVSCVAVVVLMLAPDAPTSAHQPDEYLGLTHIAIFRDRVQLFVSLTPGAQVVEPVLSSIDVNRDGGLSPDEQRRYADKLISRLALAVDSERPELRLTELRFPPIASLKGGEGVIQLTLEAFVSGVEPGRHTLFFANNNSDVLTVYVVAALKPSSAEIAIVKQERDWLQRQITVRYDIDRAGPVSAHFWLRVVLAGATAALMLGLVAVVRRRGDGPGLLGKEASR